MTLLDKSRDLVLSVPSAHYTAQHVSFGVPVPKTRRVELLSPSEWEAFVEEWASTLTPDNYHCVRRFGNAGDMGLDVVGFISDNWFKGGFDNYQCKHYDSALAPSDIWVEIGKIVFYSFSGEYPVPRWYYFVAPKGVGTSLGKLLGNPNKLKAECRNAWNRYCKDNITSTKAVPLEGELLVYFDRFNFNIFSSKSTVELLTRHSKTPFHAVRFGGGLPARPRSAYPPDEVDASENRYVQQALEAYSESVGSELKDPSCLAAFPELKQDFLRQRVRFYHAESLRNWARDTVPQGTFEELQEEVFDGVIDVCNARYDDGLLRMRATMAQSAQLAPASNALFSVIQVQDKQGICHQLANVDRLVWVRRDRNAG